MRTLILFAILGLALPALALSDVTSGEVGGRTKKVKPGQSFELEGGPSVDNTDPCSTGNALVSVPSGQVTTQSGFGGTVSGATNVNAQNKTGTADCPATFEMPGGFMNVGANVHAEVTNTSDTADLTIVPAGGSSVVVPPGGSVTIKP